MHIRTLAHVDNREQADALAIGFFKDDFQREELGRLQDIALAPWRAGDFTGKEGQVVALYHDLPQEKRILLVGLGAKEGCTLERLRRSYGALAKACLKYKCKTLNLIVPQNAQIPHDAAIKAVVEGLLLASYTFDKLKSVSDEPPIPLDEITLIGPELHLIESVAGRTKRVIEAVWRARDLINSNADETTPDSIANFAKEIAQEFPRVKVDVHDKAWIEKEGMGLLLAVSRGAVPEPKFIVASYKGASLSSDHTVLIGKGITYDTGGLKLKPLESMITMRADMSGAAVALATIEAISALNLPINVTAVIPACENAIDARSYKLGDVYKSRAGLTVEITNTDAEGRLILADAISYAVDRLNPTRIIDVATLTGGIVVALGNELMGLFSNSDSLAEELYKASHRTHELLWRMPLYQEYKDQLKSDIADLKNAATPSGGSIISALFMERFIKDVPWAHFDIAGVAFAKEARHYWPKNATGIGVRLLVDYFENMDKKQ